MWPDFGAGGGMNAAAETLEAWRYRRWPAFARKYGHTPFPRFSGCGNKLEIPARRDRSDPP